MPISGDEGNRRRPRWADRIAVSQLGDGFAYVPGHILVRGAPAEERAETLTGRPVMERPDLRPDRAAAQWRRVTEVEDPLSVIGVLRSEGLDAQPEHVFFAHGCSECERGPHPAVQMGCVTGDLGANPYRANPYRANPYRANPYRANQAPMSSAEPAPGPALPSRPELQGPGRHPRIVILDTGLAGGADDDGQVNPDHQRPALLDVPGPAARIAGSLDRADDEIVPVDGGATFPPDGYLDPVAGHGTFIAGLVEQLAKGCDIRVERVIEPMGDGRELDIVAAIEAEAARPPDERADLLSMSFGGSVFEHASALRTAIATA